MWNEPTQHELAKIPRLYATENISLKDKLTYEHFFIFSSDWYIAEYDQQDLFWGFTILNNDYVNAEWGYISFQELKELNVKGFEVDRELEWRVKKAGEIERIVQAGGI